VADPLGLGPHADFNRFLAAVESDAEQHGVKLTAKRKKLVQTVLADRDESAKEVFSRVHKPGKTEPNTLCGLYSSTIEGKPVVV
jgi:type I restriction enzyme M protein